MYGPKFSATSANREATFGARPALERPLSEGGKYDGFRRAVHVDGSDLAGALEAALELLPEERAGSIFLLSDGEGWQAPELAESLDMTPGALRTRLSRARKRLREELEPVWREYAGD